MRQFIKDTEPGRFPVKAAEAETAFFIDNNPRGVSKAPCKMFTQCRKRTMVRRRAGNVHAMFIGTETQQTQEPVYFVRHLVGRFQHGPRIFITTVSGGPFRRTAFLRFTPATGYISAAPKTFRINLIIAASMGSSLIHA